MTATTWLLSAMEVMWQSALTIIPPALLVAGVCRWGGCRPATRHLLWLVVLVLPVAIPMLASLRRPALATQPSSDFHEDQPSETPQLAMDEPDPIGFVPAPKETVEADRGEPAGTEPAEAVSVEAPRLVETVTPAAPAVSPSPEPGFERAVRACGVDPRLRHERELTDVRAGATRPLVLARGPSPAERPSQPLRFDARRASEERPAKGTIAGGESAEVYPGLLAPQIPDEVASPDSLAERCADALRVVRVGLASGVRTVAAFGRTVTQWLQGIMPPAPIRIWLAGGSVLFIIQLVNAIRFRRLARRTRPAGADLSAMVAEAAVALGLRRAPSAWLSDDRISPMVGGLLAPRLIFPAELWTQLDHPGRRAILLHELAHLHRRDHWVRALEMAVTAAFWWQPAAWWARRRIRDEAEVCCDAWVTWLLPHGRRAYATALLKTQAFVGNSAASGSGAGIGVVSVRARRFARRLTMVMSESGKPRLSPLGFMLACVPVLIAWIAAPVLSCPPQETPAPSAPSAQADWPTGAWAPVAPAPCPTPMPAPTPAAMGGSYQTYLQPVAPHPLPNLVSNLYSHLVGSTMATMLPPHERDADDRDDLEARLDRLERQLDRLSRRLEEMGAARAPAPPMAVARRGRPAEAAAPSADGPVVGKVYRLSGGKLEPLTKLMIREDVPIKVRPMGDAIEIFATPRQHEALAGFIAIIDPSQNRAVIVGPRARAGESMGGPGPGPGPGSAGGVWVMPDMKAHGKASKAAAKALEAKRRALEKQAEKLREQSDKLQERADQLKDDSRSDAGEKAAQLEQQALAMANEADQRDKLVEELERQLDAVNDAAEALESAESGDSDKDNDDGEDVIADLRAKAESDENDGSTWFQLGFALHSAKRYDEARAAFERSAKLDFNKVQSIYNIGCGYARAGNADQAIAYLKKAWEAGFNDADQYKNDDDLASLRKDPRFQALVDSNHVAR